MNFVELVLNNSGRYSYKNVSNIEMNILGNFLTDDVGKYILEGMIREGIKIRIIMDHRFSFTPTSKKVF